MAQVLFDTIIANGLVVTVESVSQVDILIKDEKIYSLAPWGQITAEQCHQYIDAEGAFITPGGIDAHVHLAEPPLFGLGQTADDYESGTRSAIAGGTTTIISFAPQQKHEKSLLTTLDETHLKADGNCYSDYSFHIIVSNPSVDALNELREIRERGVSSIKLYMTYDALKLNDYQLLDVFDRCRSEGVLPLVHAENDSLIAWMTAKLEERKFLEPKYHAPSHPRIAEKEATYRAICLSEFMEQPILIVHVSDVAATHHIRQAQKNGLPIFAETCPQYLFLTKEDLDRPDFEGAKYVCSPPLRNVADQEALWRGLEDGVFTIFSSDHCPFNFEDNTKGKQTCISQEHPQGHFKHIPNGFAGVETRLSLLLGTMRLKPEKFVALTSTNVAKLYGLYPRKGTITPGSDADIIVWYPNGQINITLNNTDLHHGVDYTPYEGHMLTQWPRYTFLRGKLVWNRDDGGLIGQKGFGRYLHRQESDLARDWFKKDWQIPL